MGISKCSPAFKAVIDMLLDDDRFEQLAPLLKEEPRVKVRRKAMERVCDMLGCSDEGLLDPTEWDKYRVIVPADVFRLVEGGTSGDKDLLSWMCARSVLGSSMRDGVACIVGSNVCGTLFCVLDPHARACMAELLAIALKEGCEELDEMRERAWDRRYEMRPATIVECLESAQETGLAEIMGIPVPTIGDPVLVEALADCLYAASLDPEDLSRMERASIIGAANRVRAQSLVREGACRPLLCARAHVLAATL